MSAVVEGLVVTRPLPPTTTNRLAGPLRTVLAEIEAGTATVSLIAKRTGLAEQIVRAAIDHLIRAGRVEAKELAIGCPPSGCGGCAMAADDGNPGCGLPSPSPTGRTALVTLNLARPKP